MVTISLCMIVKNEEDVIGRCLESVRHLVDEINIVDTGSTDRTKEIAANYTKRIFDFKWIDHFAAARNFSFQQATCDYILWLDADDVLMEKDQKAFLALKNSLDQAVDAVSMEYHLAFDHNQNVTSSIRRHRLVKRAKGFQWVGAVHEYLDVSGNILISPIAVTHLPNRHDAKRNISIYEKMRLSGAAFTPRDLFYYANELFDHGKIEQAIHYYIQFLQTKKGWVEDQIRACNKLADCYHHLGMEEQELSWTLHTLSYAAPRPETCCRLGFHFLQKEDYPSAIYWYKQAIENKEDDRLPFKNMTCSTWLPHLQLAVCYDRLGQYQLANEHNEKALIYRPDDERMLYNREYFKKKLSGAKE